MNSFLSLILTNISFPTLENLIAFDIRFNTIRSIFSGSQAIFLNLEFHVYILVKSFVRKFIEIHKFI